MSVTLSLLCGLSGAAAPQRPVAVDSRPLRTAFAARQINVLPLAAVTPGQSGSTEIIGGILAGLLCLRYVSRRRLI